VKTRERGEERRDRRQEGRHTTQKTEGGSAPGDVCTGGARGSDGRGDRMAEVRQNGGQTRGEEGRTREAHVCMHVRVHVSKKGRK
jgi:hypothetical protein